MALCYFTTLDKVVVWLLALTAEGFVAKKTTSTKAGGTEIANVRLDPKLGAQIDDYIRRQDDPELTRSAAIRCLLRKALAEAKS